MATAGTLGEKSTPTLETPDREAFLCLPDSNIKAALLWRVFFDCFPYKAVQPQSRQLTWSHLMRTYYVPGLG